MAKPGGGMGTAYPTPQCPQELEQIENRTIKNPSSVLAPFVAMPGAPSSILVVRPGAPFARSLRSWRFVIHTLLKQVKDPLDLGQTGRP